MSHPNQDEFEKSADDLNEEGLDYFNNKRFKEALECFKSAASLDPSQPSYQKNIAETYYRLGEIQKSISHYQRAIWLDQERADFYNELGLIYLNQNQLRKALTMFRKAARLEPENVHFAENEANILRKMKEFHQALRLYKRLQRQFPDTPKIINGIGACHFGLGSYAQAIPYFQLAYDLDPENYFYLQNLADAYRNELDYDQAIIEYEKLLEKTPGDDLSWNFLGICYLQREDPRAAKKAFKKAIEIDGKNGHYWINLGNAFRVTGNYRSAIGAYTKARKSFQFNPYLENALAMSHYHVKEFYSAARIYRRLLEKEGENRMYLENYIEVLVHMRAFASAAELLKKVIINSETALGRNMQQMSLNPKNLPPSEETDLGTSVEKLLSEFSEDDIDQLIGVETRESPTSDDASPPGLKKEDSAENIISAIEASQKNIEVLNPTDEPDDKTDDKADDKADDILDRDSDEEVDDEDDLPAQEEDLAYNYHLLGVCYRELGHYGMAERTLKIAMDLIPENKEYEKTYTDLKHFLNLVELQQSILKTNLKKDPRNVKHRFEMAHYYFTHKNYGSMIEFCNGLITEIVGSPPPEISLEATLKEKNNEIPVNSDSLDDCQINLVFYMYSFGHFLEAAYPVALEGIDTFLSRAPENWQGWLLKTLIHFRQSSENEADEAIEAFQEACLLNRDITVVIESLLDLKTPVLLEDVMYWLASFRCSGNQSSK